MKLIYLNIKKDINRIKTFNFFLWKFYQVVSDCKLIRSWIYHNALADVIGIFSTSSTLVQFLFLICFLKNEARFQQEIFKIIKNLLYWCQLFKCETHLIYWKRYFIVFNSKCCKYFYCKMLQIFLFQSQKLIFLNWILSFW
jgi:hypothetical protein